MTTKASKSVLNLNSPTITDFIFEGAPGSRIDNTPIGSVTPNVGFFTNLTTDTLRVTTTADFTGANIIGLVSRYADIAEMYHSTSRLEPGDVVSLCTCDESGEIKPFDATSSTVFGVVTESPFAVMNYHEEDGWYPIVMIGRSGVKAKGPVKKGEPVFVTDSPIATQMLPQGVEGKIVGYSLVNKDAREDEVNMVECALRIMP